MILNKQSPKGWKEVKLHEVLDYEQPTEYIVNSEILGEETQVPVLTANKGFIKGYTREKTGICKNLPVIIFDDFTTDSKFVNFPFKVKSSAMKILKLKDENAMLKYIFYQMQTINVRATTHKRYYLSEYQNLHFLFPLDSNKKISFDKQSLIVQAIETQFTRLDESVKLLNLVKAKLEVYRKAVLKKKLDGLKTKKLVDFCNNFKQDIVDGPFGSDLQRKDYLTQGIPVLKIQNVKENKIFLKKMDYISEQKYLELERHSFKPGALHDQG